MGKFNEWLNKKITPIPALYKNPYTGVLKDLISKQNKGETVAKEYVETQLDEDYLSRIKKDIYEYPAYAEALEVPMLQDLKNIYLKTPQTFNSFSISKHRPKNGTQTNYFNSKILDTIGAGIVVKAGDNLKNKNVVPTDKLENMNYGEISHITPNNNAVAVLPGIGHATVGIGHDQKGEYVSYYDNWDVGNFKPNTKHLIDFFNKGVPVYGRVYLDDYYDIPEEARGNPFIAPAVITAYKKGGRIHIKKKNRGKFTEYCGGKVTEECIAKGKNSKDPKIRKRATFAANARKWKHENGGPLRRPNFKESKEAYYDPETDTVFAPDSLGEFYHHEMFHARPNLQLLESLKPYYHNLNDDVLKQMGADLSFVKRFNNDPGHFYSPEELGARVISASEMLNKMGVKDVTLDFLKNARLNKNAYGDNFRDLIHMYNDENLIKIFNVVKKHKNGGILKAQKGTGNLYAPQPLSPVGIALNQAKTRAKMKEKQPHLPPGVKEVIGPDGKKVAIRTEQPLAPMEQSIAEWMPGTGDVAEVGYMADDIKNGRYGTAALSAGLMFIPGNAGKLLSKYRKTVSKTADAVEDAVRKADVSEYINTVDDALPERQPLTIQKSPQFLSYDELDDMYFRAINDGDSESIRQIQNIVWKRKAPNSKLIKSGNPIHLLHGTTNGLWTKIDPAKYSDDGISFFLTNEPEVAWTYKGVDFEPITELPMDIERGWMLDSGEWSRKIEDFRADGYDISEQQIKDFYDGKEVVIKRDPSTVSQKNKIFDFYVNSENPLVIHNKHTKNWNNLDFEGMKTTRDISKYAKDHDYTSVTIENIYDHGPFNKTSGSLDNYANDVTIVHNPKLIKSADLITYDDSGNIIPISKRFDFNINDIRWGFTPLFLGLGAAKTVSNNTKEQQ